jgi:hypothetical protein
LYERLMKTKQAPDLTVIPSMREWLDAEMRAAAIECRYPQCEKLEEADVMLGNFLVPDVNLRREHRRKETAERTIVVKDKARAVVQAWSEKIEAWMADQATRMAVLEEGHKHQLEEFERRWADPIYLVSFNKPSAKLLNLRDRQAKLAITKQFHEAKVVKVEADHLERREAAAAQRRAVASMRIEYEQLLSKQGRDIEGFHKFTDRVADVMRKDRDHSLKPFELIAQRLAVIISDRPPRERKKEGLFFPQGAPVPPHPLQGIRALTGRPRSLGLSGIQVRQYIKVPKTPKERKS